MSTDAKIHYEVSKHIAEIVLDRPPVNAFSVPFLDDILSAFRRAADDENVRAVILRSALPERFCAGLDLDIILGKSGLDVRKFLQKLYIDLWDIQTKMGKPTIAAVNGAARGGGMTLAISCDMILSPPTTRPSVTRRLIWPCCRQFTSRTCRASSAVTGLLISSSPDAHSAPDEAATLGLVSRVVPTKAHLHGEARRNRRDIR